MMGISKCISAVFLIAAALFISTASAKPASVLLQEGLYAEEVEGNLDAAMKVYEVIIADNSAEKGTCAQAMYRLGMCHLKKKDEQQAKATFEKIVAQFPDEKNIIEKIKPLLDEMQYSDPALLMPAETKIYIEIGSPGKQIETILNMLKGTQFENPLAAIAGKYNPNGNPSGGKSGGDIMAAFLNPSMMAEFKKIRGLAIGVTEIRSNNPSLVAILYPGKSDALRGLILAGLGMAGKPVEPVEGMQTVMIGNQAGVAYDDNIIIVSQPLDQLKWCVKQYKGTTNDTTLVTKNKSFAKVGRKIREQSAMTIWLDVDHVYAGIDKQSSGNQGSAAKLHAINSMADFNSIEDAIANLYINENNIGIETTVGFKDGHNCLAYDLIRTSTLNKSGFDAVPSEAFGLLSVALAEAGSSSANVAEKKIDSLSGLDIGREIFGNIEQVTLFVLPPQDWTNKNVLSKQISPLVPSVGLTITSHNAEQTRRLIAKIATAINLTTNKGTGAEDNGDANALSNKYAVGTLDKETLYCYVEQSGKSTIVSLSPEVVQAGLSAIQKHHNVLNSGPLKEPLSHLSGTVNKIAVVNIGGGIRMADAHINRFVDDDLDPNKYPLSKSLEKLAQNFDNTYIQLRTSETLNSFNLHASAEALPPLAKVIPILAQLPKLMPKNITPYAVGPKPTDGDISSGGSTILSWVPGINAIKHKVYFGAKREELAFLGEVENPTFTGLPAMEKETTYYWRVDEVFANGSVVTGKIWSLTAGKLVGWWKFDEGTGDNAADSSGLGNNGKTISPRWGDGKISGALNFEWGNAVIVPGTALSSVTRQVTVTFWTYGNSDQLKGPKREDFAWQVIDNAGNFWASLPMWSPYVNKWGTQFVCSQGFHDQTWVEFDDANNYIGSWHHFAYSKNADKGVIKIYIDGVLKISTEGMTLPILSAKTESFKIGAGASWIGNNPFNSYKGSLDDFRIYNYELSQEAIAAIYKETQGELSNEPNIVQQEPGNGI